MSDRLNPLIPELEAHVERWKQFHNYLEIARVRKFRPEDEMDFLDLKGTLTQELELLHASFTEGMPGRQEVHDLLTSSVSLRELSALPSGVLQRIDTTWHQQFIGWQSLLGRLKAREAARPRKSLLGLLR